MFKHPRLLFALTFLLIKGISFSQNNQVFTHKQKCYTLFNKAYNDLSTDKDTIRFNKAFIEIDSLIDSENNHDFKVKYLIFKGAILNRTGYHEAGLFYLSKAIEYGYLHLDSLSNRIAVGYGNMGVIYKTLGDIDKFSEYTLKSKEILQHNYKDYAGELIQTNFNLEVYLQNKPKEQIKYQQQNDTLINFIKESDNDIKALHFIKKGLRSIKINDLLNAKREVAKGISLLNNSSEIKITTRKHYYQALAMYAFISKNYSESIEHYHTYLNLIKSFKEYSANAFIYDQIGQCYKNINRPDSAIFYSKKAYLESYKIDASTSYTGHSLGVIYSIEYLKMHKDLYNSYDIDVYNNLDSVSFHLKNSPHLYLKYAQIKSELENSSQDFYELKLKTFINKSQNNLFKAYYTGELGKLYFEKNLIDKADSLFTLTLKLNKVNKQNPNSLSYNYNITKEYIQYKHQILILNKDKYNPSEIINRYDELIRSLLEYVYENWDTHDRDDILKEIKYYCNEAVKFCFENQNKDSDIPFIDYASFFANQSNSILLKYNHRRITSLENSKISKEELEKMRFYKGHIDKYFHGDKSMSRENIIDIQNEYNNFILNAEKSLSALIKFESFDSFQKQINAKKKYFKRIVIPYVGNQFVYKIEYKDNHRSMVQIDLRKKQLIQLQSQLYTSMVDGNVEVFSEKSSKLYSLFFGKEKEIQNEKILIVYSPELLPIPFECLINKHVKHSTFNKLPYLVKSNTFVYSQGLSSEYQFKKDYNLSLPYLGLYSDAGKTLINAKKEIVKCQQLLKGKSYNVNQLSKEEIISKLKQSQIIHIATHSAIDSSNSYTSKLVFSDSLDNNFNFHQIMNLDINPNLLVLNACSTGEGEYKIGEGKISIARAFNYAGAQNVLINSWDVPDFSASAILQNFMSDYKNNIEVGKSLQQSKINYLKSSDNITGNPIYWAGTVFVSSNIISNQSYLLALILSVFIFSGLIVTLLFTKYN